MNDPVYMVGLVVVAAIAFDFVNGFHDAANSIATIVATQVLTPLQAVLWASFFNFMALFLINISVAKTVGSGMIDLDTVTPLVIMAGLMGAIFWGLLSWWFRMPTSSSHALIGGYAGAAMCHSALVKGMAFLFTPIVTSGWTKTIVFIFIAPVLGFLVSGGLMHLTTIASKKLQLDRHTTAFKYMQLVSSAFLSLMHGSNDAQKTAGIIAGVLVTAGYFHTFTLPQWVLYISYATMGMGTLCGGWRIVHTMGHKLTRLQPSGGFCAESGAALSIGLATFFGLPVSTTHVTTGAILGVGASRNVKAVRWNLATNILWAWLLTIPASALIGALLITLTTKYMG